MSGKASLCVIVSGTVEHSRLATNKACPFLSLRNRERSALAGRVSLLRSSDGLHTLSPVVYSAACIHSTPGKAAVRH